MINDLSEFWSREPVATILIGVSILSALVAMSAGIGLWVTGFYIRYLRRKLRESLAQESKRLERQE